MGTGSVTLYKLSVLLLFLLHCSFVTPGFVEMTVDLFLRSIKAFMYTAKGNQFPIFIHIRNCICFIYGPMRENYGSVRNITTNHCKHTKHTHTHTHIYMGNSTISCSSPAELLI